VNEKIHDITQLVHDHLQEFLTVFGITLDTVKVLIFPKDERMRQLIALKAFGLSEIDAVRYYTAILMAERGVVSAPNMAMGVPFNIGAVPQVQFPMNLSAGSGTIPKTDTTKPAPPTFSPSPPPMPDDSGQDQ
jgi:hypothetical protein